MGGYASGGSIFSALPEKKGGEKGALGYGWFVLRVRFRQVLIFSRCEHANSPSVRYGTRRLLRYTKIDSSCL